MRNPSLTLLLVALLPVLGFLIHWFSKKLKTAFSVVRHFNAELSGFLSESLAGLPIVQLFRKQDARAKRFSALNTGYCAATVTSNVYDASLYALMEGMSAFAIGTLLWALGLPAFYAVYSA